MCGVQAHRKLLSRHVSTRQVALHIEDIHESSVVSTQSSMFDKVLLKKRTTEQGRVQQQQHVNACSANCRL